MSKTSPGDILLDAGTNELEVLVFRLGDNWFGVNVAKVREAILPVNTVQSPHAHPSVIGMFNMRGTVMPLVDLRKHLQIEGEDARPSDRRVIITEFNGLLTGFLVDGVEQIHRMSWGLVKPAPSLSGLGASPEEQFSVCTGIVELDERLVLMLDFESVTDSILYEEKLHVEKVDNELGVDRASKRIVFAEDSPFMRKLIEEVFRSSGYSNIEAFSDGESAWKAIEASAAEGETPIDAVVSDIEMPRMDGLHLTHRIKSNDRLASIPVVLFSSLISDDNLKKGEQVGADMQIAKPELRDMVLLVDRVVSGDLSGNTTIAEVGKAA